MCVIISFSTFGCNISHFEKNGVRHHTCTYVMYSNRYYCHVLMELEFSRQIFENYSYQIS